MQGILPPSVSGDHHPEMRADLTQLRALNAQLSSGRASTSATPAATKCCVSFVMSGSTKAYQIIQHHTHTHIYTYTYIYNIICMCIQYIIYNHMYIYYIYIWLIYTGVLQVSWHLPKSHLAGTKMVFSQPCYAGFSQAFDDTLTCAGSPRRGSSFANQGLREYPLPSLSLLKFLNVYSKA